ncbi:MULTISPECIES: recombinase family protein [unclassified Roseitalea]|uniref:recombinase family protein n=1 Tax=unclassified Roseitalea TaxID=2639107 RepID=UPI00273F8DF4|nr:MULTISPECIES: recombinase family protein [unclassified Roseitalea]
MNEGNENSAAIEKAVIYCRVSSAKQTVRGDGLSSQETRCREFAKYKGYDVVEVFRDDTSGSLTSRPGMQAMLGYLNSRRDDPHAVIIDDISRLARGLMAHFELRVKIADAGGVLVSPSIEFGEDSDSQLVENLLASVSQHQRQKNGEQTINRMRARVQNGYWVFQAPVGYRYERSSGHGKLLVRDEPNASVIQEALEGFASGRFETQVEVKRFLERQPTFPKDLPNGEIRNQRVTDLLTRVLYAGYIESPNWNVSLRKGKHEGLISLETHERIQARLKGTAKAPARKDINADFPLRGFIQCGDCSKPLTACWSQGKHRKYPYYLCANKGCESYRKSIKRDAIEAEFEAVLQSLEPSEGLFQLVRAMFKDAWDMRLGQAREATKTLKSNVAQVDKQIEKLLDRIVGASSDGVVSAYEKRIAKLEREKALAEEKLLNAGKPAHTFEESFEHAMGFLSSPWNIWRNSNLIGKKNVLRLAFLEPLAYCRKNGLRTPNLAFPFKALEGFCANKCEMAHPRGFEPLASAFGAGLMAFPNCATEHARAR